MLLRVRTRRTEAKAGSEGCVDPSSLGLRGGVIDLFLMQDDFTDDGASGQCLQLEGMSVGKRSDDGDFAIGSDRNNLIFPGLRGFCRAQ